MNLSDNHLCGIRSNDAGTYTDMGINAIADAINVCSNLTDFDTRCNGIRGDAAELLARVVLGSSSMAKFGLIPIKVMRKDAVSEDAVGSKRPWPKEGGALQADVALPGHRRGEPHQ